MYMISLVKILEGLPKNKWVDVDPIKYSDDLISVVQTAYKNAPKGSFINSKKDLIGSDWHSIDIDTDPDVDATIFYRKARGNESWKGIKIQGIGHDGSRPSIEKVLGRLKSMLFKKGVWIEASDALEHVLYKYGVKYISDEEMARKVFPNTDLEFTGNRGQYTRFAGSVKVKETIFGNPILK
jgi:hypothetical protein